MVRALFLTCTLAFAACSNGAARPPPAPPAKPALWKVVDADTTIYLFGTIHLLPEGTRWTGPKLNAALGRSQQLVLETILDDPAKLGATMVKLGTSPGLPPILSRVPPAKRAALKSAIAKSAVGQTTLDKMETWAVALALSSASLAAADLRHADGVEAQLTAAFKRAGKPIGVLETPEQQLGYFDSLPEAVQRKFLVSVAEDSTNIKREFAAMISAWRSGDVRKIAVTFDDEMRLTPELADVLLRRRNLIWANWVGARMGKPGTVFVAVGAGHLAGKGSVDALVARKGFKVVRVQ